MGEWKRVKLGEVISIKHGWAFPGSGIISEDSGAVLVTPGNFRIGGGFKESGKKFFKGGYPEEYRFVGGELIVTMTDLSKESDTLGVSARVPFSSDRVYLHNQRIGLVKVVGNQVRDDYVYWVMRTDDYRQKVVAGASGTTVKHTSPSRICDIEIPLPPLPTQRKIAAVLGALDDKIENNRKICANLEAQAQALFKSWFVDFDPFGGKMPSGWKMGKLGEIVSRMGTGLNPRQNFKLGKGNNYYVTIKNMGQNRVFLDDKCDKVDDDAIRRINERSDLQKGDVLFSGIGTIGRTYLIEETPKNWNTSESVFNMRPRDGIPSVYLYLLLLSDPVQEYVQLNALGSAQKGIRMADLKVCPCVNPTVDDLESFRKVAEPIIKTVQNHWRESDALAATRDALLPKLMSGEIDVEKVEV